VHLGRVEVTHEQQRSRPDAGEDAQRLDGTRTQRRSTAVPRASVDTPSPLCPSQELLTSAYRGRRQAVAALLEKKGDPNETDNLGRTALIHAAAQGHDRVVEVLIEAGTDALYSPSTDGRTALHWAAFYGHRSVLWARAARLRSPVPHCHFCAAGSAATCCRPRAAMSRRPTTTATVLRSWLCWAAQNSCCLRRKTR